MKLPLYRLSLLDADSNTVIGSEDNIGPDIANSFKFIFANLLQDGYKPVFEKANPDGTGLFKLENNFRQVHIKIERISEKQFSNPNKILTGDVLITVNYSLS